MRLMHILGSTYGSPIVDESTPDAFALSAVLQLSTNNAGTLTMQIAPENPEYAAIMDCMSIITVEDDGLESWRGRVVSQKIDTGGIKTITANGVLDFLHDTAPTPQAYKGTADDVLATIVAEHNRLNGVQFTALASGNQTQIEMETSNYATTWDALQALIRKYGGYVSAEYCDRRYQIRWIAERNYRNSQPIKFGLNLLTVELSHSISEIATVLLPHGAEDLTLSPMEDAAGIALYGRITRNFFCNSKDAAEVETLGAEELKKRLSGVLSITGSCIDLADIGTYERISIDQLCYVESPPHGVAEWMVVEQYNRDLLMPTKSRITLGATRAAASALLRKEDK